MKLVRYGNRGSEKPGLVDAAGTIRDLSGHIADITGDTVAPEVVQKLQALDTDTLPAVPADTRIGACIANVGKIICIGLNYSDL